MGDLQQLSQLLLKCLYSTFFTTTAAFITDLCLIYSRLRGSLYSSFHSSSLGAFALALWLFTTVCTVPCSLAFTAAFKVPFTAAFKEALIAAY
jgi:hypothetical protein